MPGNATDPIGDLAALPLVSDVVAARIKAAAAIASAGLPARAGMAAVASARPGVERWPVKTGQDGDRGQVGRNILAGEDLGAGIVAATVEELNSAARPADMADPRRTYPAYQAKRAIPVETTVWRVDATIISMKSEGDGDYHLVLQGASGATMIAEVPVPDIRFVGDSPWLADILAARQEIDAKFVSHLSPDTFVTYLGTLMPSDALTTPPPSAEPTPLSFVPTGEDDYAALATFATQLPPTRARVTGVGFFDAVHGQTGVSQSNGIELHPALKIEWL